MGFVKNSEKCVASWRLLAHSTMHSRNCPESWKKPLESEKTLKILIPVPYNSPITRQGAHCNLDFRRERGC